jgi:hypothetical protein
MPAIVRHGSNSLQQFLDGPSVVYGDGIDGSVTFDGTYTVLSITPSASVYQLTRDIFCYNMTVADNVRVQPNGYRIFVENLLTLGAGSVIGWEQYTGWTTAGSIQQGAAAGVSVTHSLGGMTGRSTAGTATVPIASEGGIRYYNQPLNAIRGYSMTASGGPYYVRGGAGGTTASGHKGGGVIICAARYISGPISGTATFRADADGGSGGSAGGGAIITISSASALPTNVTTSVVGGGDSLSGNPTPLPGTTRHLQAQ